MVLALGTPKRHPESGIYWFRKRVPGRLRESVGKTEIKFSLHTRDPLIARLRNLEVLLKAEHEWAGYDLAVVGAQGRAVAYLECKSSSSHESGDAPFEIPHPVFTLPLSDQEPGEQGNRSRRRRARVNEITPLTGRDFIARDGIPMMRIRAETNKTRKSRMVRLHSHLIEQGLLAYAKSRAWARCSTIPLAVAAEVMSIRTTKKSRKDRGVTRAARQR